MISLTATLIGLLALSLRLTTAHTVITYPGWRGDSLFTTGTVGADDYEQFPYGAEWAYPCGGVKQDNNRPNRTYWPIGGGAVALQPGWFSGHLTAAMHINLGYGTVPENYSLIMVPTFQINGPTNEEYPGLGICLTQIPLPANLTVNEGDNATIQVVENAKHGAALYSCVDIIFTNNMSLVAPVNETNCQNATGTPNETITFSSIYSVLNNPVSGAVSQSSVNLGASTCVMLAAMAWLLL